MIADLTKDILKDVGICAVGDIVLILKHSAKVMGIFICFSLKYCASELLRYCREDKTFLLMNINPTTH